jgi:hypothetical protein
MILEKAGQKCEKTKQQSVLAMNQPIHSGKHFAVFFEFRVRTECKQCLIRGADIVNMNQLSACKTVHVSKHKAVLCVSGASSIT